MFLLDDESTEKELRETLKQTLDKFHTYLFHDQKLKENTVSQHMGRIHFFGEAFLLNYDGTSIKDVDADQIVSFLGDFYIRKVFDSRESDIGPYLTSFKRFAKFLFEHGDLNKEDLNEINMVCKQRDYFKYRFETYFATDDLESWHFENDLYQYLDDMESAYQLEEDDTIDIDVNFVSTLNNRDFEIPQAVMAFSAFLEKISHEKSVKLTSGRQHITRNFWMAFNQSQNLELFTKPTLNQEDIGLFHFFYLAGEHLRLYKIIGNKLEPTEILDVYQQLTDKEQFAVLIDVLWNQLPWEKIQPSNVGGRIGMTQKNRSNVAGAFSQFPIDKEIILRESQFSLRLTNQLFRGITDHFLKYITPIMEYFNLFELKPWFSDDDPQRYIGIESIKINAFGIFICNQLTKMSDEIPEGSSPSLMDGIFNLLGSNNPQPIIKENNAKRNDPCPCGSGKKYKRCCM